MQWEAAFAWGLAALAVAAPLAIGGAHPTTQVILSAAAFGLAAIYAIAVRRERGVRLIPLVLPAALAAGFTVLQLVPLPSPLVHVLSARAWELRRETAAGLLMPLTLDVPATWLALARAMACLGLLVVTASWTRTPSRARRTLVAVAAAGTLVALIAIVQRLAGSDKILFFYTPRSQPGGGVWGTFVSSNHAASLLSLSAIVSAGLALDGRGGRRFAFGVVAILCAGVVLSTASRAGAVGLGVGALVLTAVVLARRAGAAAGIATAAALVACFAAAAYWLADDLRTRLNPAHETLASNQKTRGWMTGVEVAAAYPWTGVGRGAFEAPAAEFREHTEGVRLVYPENFVLQAASEWGVPLTLALMLLVVWAIARQLPSFRRAEIFVVAGGAGALAVVVHELADFGLELPGVAFPTAIALGAALGRVDERREHEEQRRRRLPFSRGAIALGVWAVALIGAAWAVPRTLDAEGEKLRTKAVLDGELTAAIARHPADDHFELLAARALLQKRDPTAFVHLNRALRLNPANGQAHHLAARTLLALGRRSQAALEYRLAAERGVSLPESELLTLLGPSVIDAVPQRSDALLRLCRWLVTDAHDAEAAAACGRAVELAAGSEASLLERIQILGGARDRSSLPAAVNELLDGRPSAEACALAVTVLAKTGDTASTEAALARALKAHPGASELLLAGARSRFQGGDLDGARALLRKSTGFSLGERLQSEELLAQIADKAGDVDAALLARARARMLARTLQDGKPIYSPDRK